MRTEDFSFRQVQLLVYSDMQAIQSKSGLPVPYKLLGLMLLHPLNHHPQFLDWAQFIGETSSLSLSCVVKYIPLWTVSGFCTSLSPLPNPSNPPKVNLEKNHVCTSYILFSIPRLSCLRGLTQFYEGSYVSFDAISSLFYC